MAHGMICLEHNETDLEVKHSTQPKTSRGTYISKRGVSGDNCNARSQAQLALDPTFKLTSQKPGFTNMGLARR